MKTLACLMYFAGAAALAFAQQTTTSASALSSADLAAIRTLNDRYRQTTLDHAWSQWAALFTTDGILMPPNGAAITGRADIEAWGRSFPPVTGFENPIAEIEGSGNLAVTRGSFTLVLAPPNQPEQQDRGKWICTLRKQPDGTWKFHRCIFNSDLPLPAGSSSGSMTATDPWMDGTWELNVAKSRFNPGPAPRSETRTYSMTEYGRQQAIYDQVDADGKRVRGESTYRLDGRDAPITGNPELDSQAVTRTGPRSASAVVKKDGRVVRTATREVSADGKTMTLQFKGVNAKGQPLDDTWVFERRTSLPARDEAAIRAAIDKGIKALVARDWANFSLYSDDAVMSPPNTTPKIGRAAIIEWNKSLAASAPVKDYRHEPTEIIGSGDFAFVRGRYTIVSQPENAPAITNTGSYFEVWRRQGDGTWKIHRNTWNSDAPVTARATHGSNVETSGDVVTTVKTEIEKHYASIRLCDDRWKAQHTLDMSMFSPEFGQLMLLNSPTWLAALAARGEHTLNWKPRDIDVQPFGNTALATFHLEGSVTRKADGSVDSRPRRVTEVWVNENGTWKEAHHHDSVYTPIAGQRASQ